MKSCWDCPQIYLNGSIVNLRLKDSWKYKYTHSIMQYKHSCLSWICMWHTAISTYCILSPHPHSDPGVLWIGCGWSASCNWHVFKMNHSGPHKMSSNDHRWSCYAFFGKGIFVFCYCFVNKVIMIPVLHHLYLLLKFESMLKPISWLFTVLNFFVFRGQSSGLLSTHVILHTLNQKNTGLRS